MFKSDTTVPAAGFSRFSLQVAGLGGIVREMEDHAAAATDNGETDKDGTVGAAGSVGSTGGGEDGGATAGSRSTSSNAPTTPDPAAATIPGPANDAGSPRLLTFDFVQLENLITPALMARKSILRLELGFLGDANLDPRTRGGVLVQRVGPFGHLLLQTDLYPLCLQMGVFGCMRNSSLPKRSWYQRLKKHTDVVERTTLAEGAGPGGTDRLAFKKIPIPEIFPGPGPHIVVEQQKLLVELCDGNETENGTYLLGVNGTRTVYVCI